MIRFLVALLASLACHAALLGALVAAFQACSKDTALPELDLTSVELSFAEKDDAASEAVQPLPASEAKPLPAPPPETVPPPEPELLDKPNPERPEPPLESPSELPEPDESGDLPPPTPVAKKKPPPRPPAPVQPAVAPRQARVDAPPAPRKAIRPDYPRGARERGEQGDVLLEVTVSAAGEAVRVRTARSSGFLELDAAAERAARNARFSPARLNGESVEHTVRLKLTFRLK